VRAKRIEHKQARIDRARALSYVLFRVILNRQ